MGCSVHAGIIRKILVMHFPGLFGFGLVVVGQNSREGGIHRQPAWLDIYNVSLVHTHDSHDTSGEKK